MVKMGCHCSQGVTSSSNAAYSISLFRSLANYPDTTFASQRVRDVGRVGDESLFAAGLQEPDK